MDHILFIYSLAEGHVGHVPFLAVVTSPALDVVTRMLV